MFQTCTLYRTNVLYLQHWKSSCSLTDVVLRSRLQDREQMYIPVLPSSPERIIVGGCFRFNTPARCMFCHRYRMKQHFTCCTAVLTLTAELYMYDLTNCTRSTKQQSTFQVFKEDRASNYVRSLVFCKTLVEGLSVFRYVLVLK